MRSTARGPTAKGPTARVRAASARVTAGADSVPAPVIARVAALRAEIAAHDRRYYDEDAPTVSDAAYDTLFRELQSLEARYPSLLTPDSPTQRVGGTSASGFAVVTHRLPML